MSPGAGDPGTGAVRSLPEASAAEASAEDDPHSGARLADISGLLHALTGLGDVSGPVVVAPYANVNTGSVHGGQRVQNGSAREPGSFPRTRVREGPIPDVEVECAVFGFAESGWFAAAVAELDRGMLFLAGRPGSGRRTAALNLLRASCGDGAPLWAVDATELDTWRPADASARGYLMDGLLPSGTLGPGVLAHVRSLLDKAGARMVIVLPDDTSLLRLLEQELHVRPVICEPPSPSRVFGSRYEAVVPDQRERERLLGALGPDELGGLLAPELVPAEVVELVDALVSADGDAAALGDLGARLSHRVEQEVPDLVAKVRDEPDALAFLLSTCVYEGLDHRIVREEADRLLELSGGRLAALLPATDAQGDGKTGRPNPDFVFRRSLTALLGAVGATRQAREIRTGRTYVHSVEPVVFVRHRQAQAVLRHVWREYGQLSELLADWLRDVRPDPDLVRSAGLVIGRGTIWGGGHQALRHVQILAESERTTSRVIAAHALSVAAQDPVLVAEVRYRLQRWSRAASPRLRTTVAYACGASFGAARPDLALRLLRTLMRGMTGHDGADELREALDRAVRTAFVALFEAGNEELVFGRLVDWLDERDGEAGSGGGREGESGSRGGSGIHADYLLVVFAELLRSPNWLQRHLADATDEGLLIVELIRRALNSDNSFAVTCRELLRWADRGRWDGILSRAVENLFSALAESMRHGEFRLFVEMDRGETHGWAGREVALYSLYRWRSGELRKAS
ncbi:hypothetical protein ACFXAZ_32180 [Streptomyces sp. NPDC059477]|uniref:hypothetical protein n=1 Tax=Streptomyces sp. NPDC059477 TaxID=3346847 RepID=UPI00369EBA60